MVKYIFNLVVHCATNARNVVAQCQSLVAQYLRKKTCRLKEAADERTAVNVRLVALFPQNFRLHVVSHWATETLILVVSNIRFYGCPRPLEHQMLSSLQFD